tara:strand:+ start:4303 stop:4470 length:168 start_codon:yes stop_codon:yes gene_type:complete
MTYKKHENKDYDGKIIEVNIINTETGAFIPPDPKNADYIKYLKWVSDGNSPQEAD